MSTLYVRFVIHLANHALAWRHEGPLFHRWLPEGESDAIGPSRQDNGNELILWFERYGYVGTVGLITFAHDKREVDPILMAKQGVLDGGPLHGKLTLRDVSDDELAAVQTGAKGNVHYLYLARRAVDYIHHETSRFINILRTNYGQHWLSELPQWDSSVESIGNYCRGRMGLTWRTETNAPWQPFIPDEEPIQLTARMSSNAQFKQYLTHTDWAQLAETLKKGYQPDSAGLLLARAHQLMDEDSLKYALVEAVTALDIALGNFLRAKIKNSSALKDAAQSFYKLQLPARTVALTAFLENVNAADLEAALEAIKMRNKVAHEGWQPSEQEIPKVREKLLALFAVIGALLDGPSFRFPKSNIGNKLVTAEEWDK